MKVRECLLRMRIANNIQSQTPITTLPPLQNRHTYNTTPLQLQTHIHSIVNPGFVDEPRGGCGAAGTIERQHSRRTNHGTIGPPPCYRRWWVDNNNTSNSMYPLSKYSSLALNQ